MIEFLENFYTSMQGIFHIIFLSITIANFLFFFRNFANKKMTILNVAAFSLYGLSLLSIVLKTAFKIQGPIGIVLAIFLITVSAIFDTVVFVLNLRVRFGLKMIGNTKRFIILTVLLTLFISFNAFLPINSKSMKTSFAGPDTISQTAKDYEYYSPLGSVTNETYSNYNKEVWLVCGRYICVND